MVCPEFLSVLEEPSSFGGLYLGYVNDRICASAKILLPPAVRFGHHSSTSAHLCSTVAADASGQQSPASRLRMLYTTPEVRSKLLPVHFAPL